MSPDVSSQAAFRNYPQLLVLPLPHAMCVPPPAPTLAAGPPISARNASTTSTIRTSETFRMGVTSSPEVGRRQTLLRQRQRNSQQFPTPLPSRIERYGVYANHKCMALFATQQSPKLTIQSGCTSVPPTNQDSRAGSLLGLSYAGRTAAPRGSYFGG